MKNFFKNLLVTILLWIWGILTLFLVLQISFQWKQDFENYQWNKEFSKSIKSDLINTEEKKYLSELIEIRSINYTPYIFWLLGFSWLLLWIFLVKKFGWKASAYKILISQILTNWSFLSIPFIIWVLIYVFINDITAFETQKQLMIWFVITLTFFIIWIFLTKKWKLQRQIYGILAPIYIFLWWKILFFIFSTTEFIKFFPLYYILAWVFAVIFFMLGILWISEHQVWKMKWGLYFLGFWSLFWVIGLAILIFWYEKNPFVEKNDVVWKNIDSKKFEIAVQNTPENDNKKLSDLISSFDIKNELWYNIIYSWDYLNFSNTWLVIKIKKQNFDFNQNYFSFSPYLTGKDFENYYQNRKYDFEKLDVQFSWIDQKLSDIKTLVWSWMLSVYYDSKNTNNFNEFIWYQSFVRQLSSNIYENWIHWKKEDAKKKLLALNKLTDQMLFIDSNLVRSLVNVVWKQITYQTIYSISLLPNTSLEDRKFLSNLISPKNWHKIAQNTVKYDRLYTYRFLDILEKWDWSENITFWDKKITSWDMPNWLYDDKETKKIIDNNYAWLMCDINKNFWKNEKCEFSNSEMKLQYLEKLIYFPWGILQRNIVWKYFISAMIPRLTWFSQQMKKLQDFEIYLKDNLN